MKALKKEYLIGLLVSSILGASITLIAYQWMNPQASVSYTYEKRDDIRLSNYSKNNNTATTEPVNFVTAAKTTTPAVVHIRSTVERQTYQDPFEQQLRYFFGTPHRNRQPRPSVGTGSGVILSPDGYIVTNNHVIDNATDIEVLLNDNRTLKAELVGTDPTTDLALLKIDEENLDYLTIGDSDEIEVGEWVLAVGNPYEFRSTVTAGIISAKARNINILKDRNNLQIESFLQTDAAVNPGNSGGALVNIEAELVGINTAIASPSGTFAGYSFAIPSNLVQKVVSDLKEFGVVQRALLGINIRDVDSKLAEEKRLNTYEGVYVVNVKPKSGAQQAGIEEGDIIIAINGQKVKKTSELQEKIALNRPGDKVDITYLRNEKQHSATATLKNTLGTTASVNAVDNTVIIHGAKFKDLNQEEKDGLNLKGGAKLVNLDKGIWKETGIKEGFIVTSVDKAPIRNVEDLSRMLNNNFNGSGILIQGIYPNEQRAYYGIGW